MERQLNSYEQFQMERYGNILTNANQSLHAISFENNEFENEKQQSEVELNEELRLIDYQK